MMWDKWPSWEHTAIFWRFCSKILFQTKNKKMSRSSSYYLWRSTLHQDTPLSSSSSSIVVYLYIFIFFLFNLIIINLNFLFNKLIFTFAKNCWRKNFFNSISASQNSCGFSVTSSGLSFCSVSSFNNDFF